MNDLTSHLTAREAFFAIQETDGRARLGDGWVVDAVLRRLVLQGVDLSTLAADDVVTADEPTQELPEVTAVLMAGGRGSRLQPLTFKVPKPLLMVGRTSILERLLECLFAAGIRDIWISVNYMAEQIEERIGDGRRFGVDVRYLREDEPLWTAGALSLLPEPTAGPLLVLNTDQITSLNFRRMVDYHLDEQAVITVAAVPYDVEVPYGVLDVDGTRLVSVQEKPTTRFQCNAGFYVVDPSVLPMIPGGQPLTMPSLMQEVLDRGMKVAVFPVVEKWIDIGTPEDLQQALLTFATGEEV